MKKISEMTVIVQKPGSVVSDMAGEKVMLNIQNGKYYNLGSIGGVIWDIIAQPVSVEIMISQLMNEYEVDRHECANQVFSFLEKLAEEELIQMEEIKISSI